MRKIGELSEELQMIINGALEGDAGWQIQLGTTCNNMFGSKLLEDDEIKFYKNWLIANANGETLFHIGNFYTETKQQKDEYYWYRFSAAKGNKDALYHLGVIYEVGNVVQQDCQKARESFEKAAQKGNAKALYALGNMYIKGECFGRQIELAAELWKKAIMSGNNEPLYNFGTLLESLGPLRWGNALAIFKLASELGDEEAAENVVRLENAISEEDDDMQELIRNRYNKSYDEWSLIVESNKMNESSDLL